jgi:hypothetical protein
MSFIAIFISQCEPSCQGSGLNATVATLLLPTLAISSLPLLLCQLKGHVGGDKTQRKDASSPQRQHSVS